MVENGRTKNIYGTNLKGCLSSSLAGISHVSVRHVNAWRVWMCTLDDLAHLLWDFVPWIRGVNLLVDFVDVIFFSRCVSW